MHSMHIPEFAVNLTDAERETIEGLRARGWAITCLSPTFTGGGEDVRLHAETAMRHAGYISVYEYHVG